MINWIYITSEDNSARYALGVKGIKVLAFVGINPSTAHPNELDPTIKRVKRFCIDNGYAGWIMLNVYPQRATDPNDMHKTVDKAMHQMNCDQIQSLVKELTEVDFCAAWGVEIGRRPYLFDCLRDIANAIGTKVNWLHLSELTKNGHPRHPLYLKASAELKTFNIYEYITNNG